MYLINPSLHAFDGGREIMCFLLLLAKGLCAVKGTNRICMHKKCVGWGGVRDGCGVRWV